MKGFLSQFDRVKQEGRRKPKIKLNIKDRLPDKECIGSLFIDSGAHSLLNLHIMGKSQREKYQYFESEEFWKYVDSYAEFLKKNLDAIDYYVNVDVIYNPKMSWRVLKYLEKKHGLSPVPVIHFGTDVSVLERHLNAGYDFIGLGGVALEGTRTTYIHWADQMFDRICSTPDRTPCVKVHGFAMTAYDSLIRYPWWSVDSASWVKAGGFGFVYVPKCLNGEFVFVPEDFNDWNQIRRYKPDQVACSAHSPSVRKVGKSFQTVTPGERAVWNRWFEEIGVPLGSVFPNGHENAGEVDEWGVVSHHSARKIANLYFYERLRAELPKWPWSFRVRVGETRSVRVWNAETLDERSPFEGVTETDKMILYYSGSASGAAPECVLHEHKPGVMLTYWEMHESNGETTRRFERHAERVRGNK